MLTSLSLIMLDFRCTRPFKKQNLGWADNDAQVVMVELQEAVANNYTNVVDAAPFSKD